MDHLLNRHLVLMMDGKPLCWGATVGEVREAIAEYTDDDVDLMQVWRVYPADTMTPANDFTLEFAKGWATLFGFGHGVEPSDYLAPYPAFVRQHAGEHLIKKFSEAAA